jgi:alanine-glyoxylate transaminase/serine-glyoxylate transaminase/serine-pyruvate transaminase
MVAPEVLEALSRPMIGFLDPVFGELLEDMAAKLRSVFRTSNRMTFAVSGTGSAGLEASLINLLEPGDEVVICVNGVFGTRMMDVATRAGAKPVALEADWGQPIEADAVREALAANPQAKVFAMVHAETSTGVAQPMDEIAAIVRDHGALFVLDTVTSLSGMPVEIDAWGIDVAYAGTQKCLSVPPGLAPISYSDRALERVRSRRTPVQSWYLDVTLLEKYWDPTEGGRVYHHTAPVSMITALHAGLSLILDEGLEARWERHASNAEILRRGLLERGFVYVAAEGMRLPMLHCVRLPEGHDDEAALRRRLLDEHSIEISGGLGPFAGVCWRIGLMGHSSREANVERLLAAIDAVL